MDKKVIIASAVVGCLGLLSAILGFAAEGGTSIGYRTVWTRYGYRRVKVKTTSASAPGLGIGAAIFLLAAQITFSVVSGCCGCCKSRTITSKTKRIVGVVVCAVFSWILAVIAFVLFLVGTGSEGAFAGAGALTLIATALGITSFIMLRGQPVDAATTTVSRDIQPPPVVIMVAQPQVPMPESARSQNKPGEEQLPAAGVALDDLQPSPTAAAGAPNKQGEKLPPTEACVGHTQSEPATPQGTPNKQGEQPSHTVVTTSQPQLPLPHVYVLQRQPQPQGQDVQPMVVGVTLGESQLQQPQVYLMQPQPQAQYPVQNQTQVTTPTASLPQVNKPERQQTGIGKELLKAGAELGINLLVDAVLSDNTDPLATAGSALLSMATDATGGDAGATGSGDAAC